MRDENGLPPAPEAPSAEHVRRVGDRIGDRSGPVPRPLRSGRWLRRYLRCSAAASGLGALTLPLLAAAVAAQAEGLVSALGIDGVTGVALGADGAATLTLANGQTMVVAAAQVQVVAGEVLISMAAAETVAAAAAAAVAGGTVAAGGSGLAFGLGGLGLAGVAAVSGDPAPQLRVEAVGDGVLNAAEIATPLALGGGSRWIDDGTAIAVDLLDASGASVLPTPVTTVLQAGRWAVSLDPGLLAGLPDGSYTVQVRALDAAGGETAAASLPLRIDQTPPVIAIERRLSEDGLIGIAERDGGLTVGGTTEGAEPGQVVTVSVDGVAAATGVVGADGSWAVTLPAVALAGLADGATFTLSAAVADAAGNPATPAVAEVATDFTRPAVAIDAISGDDVITLADLADDLVITGSATGAGDGQTVTVGFAGASHAGTLAGGVWSVTVPQAVLAGLPDGVAASVTAMLSDAAGNMAVPAIRALSTDFSAPSIAIDPIAGDDLLNAAEQGAGLLTIMGRTTNVEAGQGVSITVARQGGGPGGSFAASATVGADGRWSAEIAAPGTDGAVYTVTAATATAEGVAATPAVRGVTVDLTPPALGIDTPLAIGAFLNAAEAAVGLSVTGTVAGHDGRPLAVALGGVAASEVTVTGGLWTAQFVPGALSGLSAGPATLTAGTADAAGNPASVAAPPVTVDLTAPVLGIDALPFGGVLNAAARDAGFTVSGTAADNGSAAAVEGAVVQVTLVLPTGSHALSATVTGGTWSVDVSPADYGAPESAAGAARIEARLSDAAGNAAEASRAFEVDFAAPELTVDPPAFGAFLGAAAAASGGTVTGTVSGNDGAPVRVALGGVEVEASVAGGVWSAVFAPGALSGLAEGPAAIIVRSTDAAGNAAEVASAPFTVDFTPPVLGLTSLGTEGLADLSSGDGGALAGTVDGAAGGSVAVQFRGETYVAALAGDGGWSVTIPASALAGLSAAAVLPVTVGAVDAAGNAAVPLGAELVGYRPGPLSVAETGRAGASVDLAVLADPGRLSEGAIATGYSFAVAVTPPAASLVPGATLPLQVFGVIEGAAIASGIVSAAGLATAPLPEGLALLNIGAMLGDPGAVLAVAIIGRTINPAAPDLQVDEQPVGPSLTLIGSDAGEALVAMQVDTTIRGRGGDDGIDLRAGGAHTVLFEPVRAANGTDTVLGFDLGDTGALPDRIGFAGLDLLTLRGAGNVAELLGAGDAVGADTGLVVYTDMLGAEGWLGVLQSLGGWEAGDVVYALGSGGTDAELLRIELGTDLADFADAGVEAIARFAGLADLSGFAGDNLLGFTLAT